MSSSSQALPLARGGVVCPSAAGWIQYGAVPETIKDTMVLPGGVPAIYVVPRRLFDPQRGVSLAELEFPCYYNFFIRGRRTTVVCRREQRPLLQRLLAEAVFGPAELDAQEFSAGSRQPNLAAEIAYFRRNPKRGGAPMELEDLVEFTEYDAAGMASLAEGVAVALEDAGGVSILEHGRTRFTFPAEPPLPASAEPPAGNLKAFWAPMLGVSVIGAGHGFDPGNRTSGFIIWIEGQGVLVDPPVDSVDWLRGYDISSKQVNTLILTHCHADHDAGTLQKVLEEGRVTIYATPTVMGSFVTKYSALTGKTPQAFRALFDHVPVRAGEPVYLHGAEATFHYSLHSIPCAGFEIKLRGRSLMYPSDTLNEPAAIQGLHDNGVLSTERRDSLLKFPWHHSLILHEAGIPPIHTPLSYLSTLSEEVKARTLLVHVSEKSIPAGSGLRVAPTGLENTVDLGASNLAVQEAIEVLDAFSRVEIFHDLPLGRASEILKMACREFYQEGDVIVRKGQPGDAFYVVRSGHVAVVKNGAEFKTYSAYDYFGETAIIMNQPRVADVVAKSMTELLVLTRSAFLHLLRGTNLTEKLAHLARVRELPSWELLSESPVFREFTSNQKTQLQSAMSPAALEPGEDAGSTPFLVAEGQLEVLAAGVVVDVLGAGSLAADLEKLMDGEASRYRFRARSAARGFHFDRALLRKFLVDNPGGYVQLSERSAAWALAEARMGTVT